MTDPALPTPRRDLDDLSAYHSPQIDVSVRLNTNESPQPPPADFVDEWCRELTKVPLNRYPDRSVAELRSAIAQRLRVRPQQIFCANGSNEVLQTLLLTYGGTGREAVVFEPTYALHGHIARVTGTNVVAGDRRADFSVDTDAAVALVAERRPAVIFLCSPNNPTGTVDPPELLAALRDAAPESLVVLDEAYGEFADRTMIDAVADDVPLVVVRTFSKVWSLAALRLGFCVAPAGVVAELDKVVLPYHLSAATQTAGLVALRYVAEMEARVSVLRRERDRTSVALGAIEGLEVYESGANFVLVRPDGDAHAVWERLLARGVLVRDFTRRPGLEGTLRITIGTPTENDALITALEAAIGEEAA